MIQTVHLALAGNPNTGKSTIFNGLTGSNQHVGNWPGKTVARRAGWFIHHGLRFEVLDLPGTYSLSPYAPDEQIARDYVLWGRPDLVVNVVDASNLERNLYLTAQLLEAGAPLLLALNMQDLAARRGYHIDVPALARLLGVPVVPMTAARGDGLMALQDALCRRARALPPADTTPRPSNGVERDSGLALVCPHCRHV